MFSKLFSKVFSKVLMCFLKSFSMCFLWCFLKCFGEYFLAFSLGVLVRFLKIVLCCLRYGLIVVGEIWVNSTRSTDSKCQVRANYKSILCDLLGKKFKK